MIKEIFESKIKVSLDEEIQGIVLLNKEETQTFDLTYQTLIKHIFEKEEDKIQKILF